MKLERDPVWGPIFNRFAIGCVKHVAEMILSMPLPLARRAGDLAGRAAARILSRKIRFAAEQAERALGPGGGKAGLESVVQFGQLLPEVVHIRKTFDREHWRRHIDVRGEVHLRSALAMGRGVVAVSAHLGNWEIGACTIGHLGGKLSWLLRPVENPFLQDALNQVRATAGVGVITKWGGLREAMHVLRRGEILAMLVDQDARDQGVFVPFFGREASTLKSPALLSMRTGAPILPFAARRRKDGRMTLDFAEPFVAEGSHEHEEDLARATARFTAVIEGWIRETPEQWLWIHRRWKTQREAPAAGVPAPG